MGKQILNERLKNSDGSGLGRRRLKKSPFPEVLKPFLHA